MSGLAEEEIGQSSAARRWRVAGGAALAIVAIAAAVLMFQGLGGKGQPPQKQITKITVLPDTPPPPPPPPKEEKVVKETREAKLEQPKQVEMPQEVQQLKMEGQAGAGDGPFSSGPVASEYIGGSVGGVNPMLAFGFFTNALQRHIQEQMARNAKLKLADYRVLVNIWIAGDGKIRRAELAGSTGNGQLDETLQAVLTNLEPLRSAVPDNLPQPVRLRITNRMTG